MGTKKTISIVAVPLVAAAAITAWVQARWTRRVAAKGTFRILRWRPTWKVLRTRPARKGLFKALGAAGKAGKTITRYKTKTALKKA